MNQEIYKLIGQKIRAAREQLGISQAELAQMLDYNSAATVSHFESGLRKVSVEDLFRLAEVLQIPAEYFYSVQGEPNTQQVRFRAAEVRPSVRGEINSFLRFAQNHAQIPRYSPEFSNESVPWKAAEKALRLTNIPQPPVYPEKIAEVFNIPVFEWAFPDEISGLFVTDEKSACIAINQNHPRVRQRFTLAHELGHFFFSGGAVLFVDFLDNALDLQSDERRAAETKANLFAADLLMPKAWLSKDFKEQGIDGLPIMAQKYQVSEQALWFRLLNLKLVQEN